MNVYKCFPEGKFKALTMSYDDGKEEDRKLVKIFNKNGIRGTFNLNSGSMNQLDKISKEEVKELYKGHEVSSHTVTHPSLDRCVLTQVAEEVLNDRKELEQIVEYPVRGFAYPNGAYNQNIMDLLPSLGIEYARIVGDSNNFYLQSDFMKWQPTCHHDHMLMENAKRFVETKNSKHLYLMYVWGHSYEFSMNQNWDLIENFCDYMGNRDDIWYATNIEYIDYIKILDQLKFSADRRIVYNPCAKSAWIICEDKVVEIKGGSQLIIENNLVHFPA